MNFTPPLVPETPDIIPSVKNFGAHLKPIDFGGEIK